ncbi:hypothetical protein [Demequina soli]|uniref:hypothetical protein n=1 Tax=Demequina soli TaxID=1638987 RepID=UPI0007845936|nr:hypothetical protein [Demequina soli]
MTSHAQPSFLARIAAIVVLLLASTMTLAGTADAKSGNSFNAKACQKGGYLSLATSEDRYTPFASSDACTAYAARGGVIMDLKQPGVDVYVWLSRSPSDPASGTCILDIRTGGYGDASVAVDYRYEYFDSPNGMLHYGATAAEGEWYQVASNTNPTSSGSNYTIYGVKVDGTAAPFTLLTDDICSGDSPSEAPSAATS